MGSERPDLLVPLADKVPADKDVNAGWVAFAVFVALCLAVACLGFSLTRHLARPTTTPSAASSTRATRSPATVPVLTAPAPPDP